MCKTKHSKKLLDSSSIQIRKFLVRFANRFPKTMKIPCLLWLSITYSILFAWCNHLAWLILIYRFSVTTIQIHQYQANLRCFNKIYKIFILFFCNFINLQIDQQNSMYWLKTQFLFVFLSINVILTWYHQFKYLFYYITLNNLRFLRFF